MFINIETCCIIWITYTYSVLLILKETNPSKFPCTTAPNCFKIRNAHLRKRDIRLLQLITFNINTGTLTLWAEHRRNQGPCGFSLSILTHVIGFGSIFSPRSSSCFWINWMVLNPLNLTKKYPMYKAWSMKYMECLHVKNKMINVNKTLIVCTQLNM